MDWLKGMLAGDIAPEAYVIPANTPIDTLRAVVEGAGFSFFYLDGLAIRNQKDFHKQIAQVFHFPDYYGKNWDALADCLSDMSWWVLETNGDILVYNNFHHFAQQKEYNFSIALGVLQYVARHTTLDCPLFVLLRGDVQYVPAILPLE